MHRMLKHRRSCATTQVSRPVLQEETNRHTSACQLGGKDGSNAQMSECAHRAAAHCVVWLLAFALPVDAVFVKRQIKALVLACNSGSAGGCACG